MPEINEEIKEVAKSMEESVMTPKDQLMKTINELGPEGIKAKMDTLTKSEKEVLQDALEEIKKGASPAMDADYQAKYVKGNVYKDTVIQEDIASDDADEKLVKPKNAKMKNQGDNAPEGFEGQVIKSIEAMNEEADELIKGLFPDMTDMVSKKSDYKETKDDIFRKIKRCAEEIKDMKEYSYSITREVKDIPEAKDVFEKRYSAKLRELKSLAKEHNAMKKSIDIAKDADKTADEAVKKVKKVKEEDHTKKKMQKSKEELIEMKKSIEVEMIAKGEEPTSGLVKGKMKAMLKEEEQSKDDLDSLQKDKVRGDKSIPADQNVGKENKDAQTKVNDNKQGKMKKSVNWADQNALLKSDRGGRNHHFSVNGYYDEALAKTEPKVEGTEDLKKSEPEVKDYDINDLIEKDMTTTWKELDTAQGLAKSMTETNGQLVKSFETDEIAASLGLSKEEAKKILGE